MLSAGLYIIATPIGNLDDISLRAIKTLQQCDYIFCEDTRVSQKLLNHLGIEKPLGSYHDHNEIKASPKIVAMVESGQKIALISDAGTPLISDPGYKLIQLMQQRGLYYTIISGPSAVIAGLVLSGMPTNQFFFAGFADVKKMPSFNNLDSTLVFFESSRRIIKTINAMAQIYPNRHVAIAREISKKFEEIISGEFDRVLQKLADRPVIKGEIVVVLSPPIKTVNMTVTELELEIKQMLLTHSTKQTSQLLAKKFNLKSNDIYKQIIKITETESTT